MRQIEVLFDLHMIVFVYLKGMFADSPKDRKWLKENTNTVFL